MIHVIGFNLFLAACLIYSLKRGGKPEKAAMLFQVAAAILTIIAIKFLPHSADFYGLSRALFMVDVALLGALIGLALRANRLWTITLAGLQLSTVFVHLSKAVFPALPSPSYGIIAQFWAWPMLVTTALGIHFHGVRKRRLGEEQDWKPLWPHSVQIASTT